MEGTVERVSERRELRPSEAHRLLDELTSFMRISFDRSTRVVTVVPFDVDSVDANQITDIIKRYVK